MLSLSLGCEPGRRFQDGMDLLLQKTIPGEVEATIKTLDLDANSFFN